MNLTIPHCERMGISPKWPKRKSVAEQIGRHPGEVFDMMLVSIQAYVLDKDAQGSQKPTPFPENLGRSKASHVLALAATNAHWRADLAHWTRYYQVGVGQNFFWHHRFNSVCPDHPHGGLFMFNLEEAAHMMAIMALLGWAGAMVYQGYLTYAALQRNYSLQLHQPKKHRRAQTFMLRLFADWVRGEGVGDASSHPWPTYEWPAHAYAEPIYETLLAHWRTPDPQELVPCLLAACDRHTHQTGTDTLNTFFDFQNLGLSRTPIEILLVFRLRQWLGLDNPVLEHPLMAKPFGQLPLEQPMPELDWLMQGVLQRARRDWPQYDDVLALDNLKSKTLKPSKKHRHQQGTSPP